VPQRITAVGLVLVGLAVALEASTFNVNFLTDPLGPKALPWLVAALFSVSGLALGASTPTAEPQPPAGRRRPVAGAATVFLAWSLTLAPLGFVISTPLAVAALARLFGGDWKRGLLTGALLTTLLWLLFALALALPLPQGSLWTR
jgi:putative tricarboxylic transport membrane protein